ncbi:Soluble scavenger receptor cysteine-rich domain-containing protein SSC5D [Tupaia chinensis]|uniref:Soluble scavenger receptor cysteine-rich domain-containing protein SSC5D n=1 Tax=Tupaia chinensis TaxID=246437 RepID=L9KPV1_TUPCH|nr:Soluble scavenger receptor cysteine-rich domain-containing protein SSC5D [Tupaia chinensis]
MRPYPRLSSPVGPDAEACRAKTATLALVGIQALERLRLADGPHGCAGRLEVWHGGRWGTPPLCPPERLRLADGPHGCAGRLEVWHGGRWGTVCDDGWDLRDFFGEGTGPVWLSELACRGGEGQLDLCPHRGWKAHICSHEEDAGAVCAGQRVANSRDGSASLVEGEPWPGLSGELSPSSEEPPATHAPRPAGSPQSGSRKKSPRPPKQPKSTRAPLLVTGGPRQGLFPSGKRDAGRWNELLPQTGLSGGRWGTVCDDGWDLRDAAVACRELGCGGALAAPGGARFGPGAGPVWMDDVGCGGGEQALRDCPRSPWGRSNCDHSEDAGLVCTGPAPRLRLADGPHGCAGRLEVWHGGRWGSVCDDAWDLRDAAVACRELGCGGALAAPGGAFFGEGVGPIILDDLRCRGNETALRFCPARPWGQHDCHHREDAGAVCDGMPLGYVPPTAPEAGSNSSAPRPLPATASQAPGTAGPSSPPASPTVPPEPGPEAGSPQLRLVAGPSRCSGRLEVWHGGRWGTVCDDGWDMRDAAVVCRELGCGRPLQPDPAAGRFGWGAGPIWLDDVGCVGTEPSLSDCPAAPWGKHNCAHNEDVGVACSGPPGLDSISDPFSWSWIPGLGGDPDARLPGEMATKPSASLTSRVPERTTKAPGKMPKSTKKWVTKNARRPTTHPPVTPAAKRPGGLGTQSPAGLTSRTTTATTAGAARTATSASTTRLTTAALTTRAPRELASEHTPQASLEPPKTPAEGSPAPTAGATAEPGPFRVRLADGPNRCAGRLEVWHAGRWGTVCDDNWDLRDATVACWELGCGKVRPRVGKTHYGPGTGPIWLDDVGCKGGEASLSDCPAGPWGEHNCDHEEDVGLTCTGYTDDDDYPPWTWDPTSGEDLAKGTPTAGAPGHTRHQGTTGRPAAPSPAPRRLPDTDEPAWSQRPWRGSVLRTPRRHRSSGSMAPASASAREEARQVLETEPGPARPSPRSSCEPAGASGDPTAREPARSRASVDSPRPPAHKPWSPAPPPARPDLFLQLSGPGQAGAWQTVNAGSCRYRAARSALEDACLCGEGQYLSTVQNDTHNLGNSDEGYEVWTRLTPGQEEGEAPDSGPKCKGTPESWPGGSPRRRPWPAARTAPPAPSPAPSASPGPPDPPLTSDSGPQLTPDSAGTWEATSVPPDTSPLTPDPASWMNPDLILTSPDDTLSSPDPGEAVALTPALSPTPPPTVSTELTSDASVPSEGTRLSPASLTPGSGPTQNPDPTQSPGSLGPCVAPTAPVRVMACEPPALVELVAAVREVGAQLQKLAQVLEQDRQERQALGVGLAQLVGAAQGLSQLGETVKKLAEAAWHPGTPAPTTTTPEEEERPLRGDV